MKHSKWKTIGVFLCLGCLLTIPLRAATPDAQATLLYVALTGSDENPGTVRKPFATLEKAKAAVRERLTTARKPIRVLLREGTYYLSRPLEFRPEDSGSVEAPVTYTAAPGERVTLSGGRRLDCHWRPYQGGIAMCDLPEAKAGKLAFTQLFINGKRQIRARYPKYDNSHPGKSGYIYPAGVMPAGMVDPQPGPNDDMTCTGAGARGILFDPRSFTKKRWARPQETVLHVFQGGYWGNLQWRIKAIDYQRRAIWSGEGGQQLGAKWDEDPAAIDPGCRPYPPTPAKPELLSIVAQYPSAMLRFHLPLIEPDVRISRDQPSEGPLSDWLDSPAHDALFCLGRDAENIAIFVGK